MRALLLLPAILLTAGCSAVAVPPGTSLSTAETRASAEGVEVYETLPAGARQLGQVEATSCQRLQWDPAPTQEAALDLLKAKAKLAGATGLMAVTYRYNNVNFKENCFGNIIAKGMAIERP